MGGTRGPGSGEEGRVKYARKTTNEHGNLGEHECRDRGGGERFGEGVISIRVPSVTQR